MTREAKIGLLTGLGVIVLIGVLLSEYLGGPSAGTAGAAVRMAALPIGAGYRERMMQPAGVPGMAPSAPTSDGAGAAIEAAVDGPPPRGYAAQVEAAGGAVPVQPVVAGAVTPIPAGQALGIPAAADGVRVPVIQLVDPPAAGAAVAGRPVAASSSGLAAAADSARVGEKKYAIVSGDTLVKIAAKFYQSGKPENVQRIVAANPGVLKNAGTMLVVGRKLMIPDVQTADAPKAAAKVGADDHGARKLVVYAPGARGAAARDEKDSSGRLAAPPPPRSDAPKEASKKEAVVYYVVKHGDTLGAIAARHLGNGSKEEAAKMMAKIVALNKIKDAASLQVGMKLKLPAR